MAQDEVHVPYLQMRGVEANQVVRRMSHHVKGLSGLTADSSRICEGVKLL